MFRLFSYFCISFLLISLFSPMGQSEAKELNCGTCEYWQARVDPAIPLPETTVELNEENFLKAVECLLALRGRISSSRFPSAVVSSTLSRRFPSPTIEIASLYYISFLYYDNQAHCRAIVLVDKDGNQNTKESIETAYKAYQSWFEKVKEIGLEKAGEQKLDPLAGTDVRWY